MRSEHFSEKELHCRHCGVCRFSPEFLIHLERLRRAYGQPMSVTSGYRCPDYDATVGGRGAHQVGAVDVAVNGDRAYTFVTRALQLKWTGIGVKQHGAWEQRFIHIDRRPEPRFWSYNA